MTDSASPPYNPLEESLKEIEAPEQRIRICLDHMRAAISQEGKPEFRRFWEARKACVGLFQEGIHPAIRSKLWAELRELTEEVRRLKEHLHAQAEFAAEQLELAVKSLEEEVEEFADAVASAPHLTAPFGNRRVERALAVFDPLHRQITRLTSWASRINALRKELIQTDMRVGKKTKLFRRLSILGDAVFPRRRELVQETSDAFVLEVEKFSAQLNKEPWPAPLYALRDDIRAYQAFAKVLTLGAKGFSTARQILSTCWERVQEREEEWKQEQNERRASLREVLDTYEKQVVDLQKQHNDGALSDEQTSAALGQIERDLQDAGCAPRDYKEIGAKMRAVRGGIEERRSLAEERARKQQRARAEKSAEQAQFFIDRIEHILTRLDVGESESDELKLREQEAQTQWKQVCKEAADADLLPSDQERLASVQKRIQERLDTLTEERRLIEHADRKNEHVVLQEVLAARLERRGEIRELVEQARRTAGGSGLDFEGAMEAQQEVEMHRSRLAQLDADIDRVKRRLDFVEG